MLCAGGDSPSTSWLCFQFTRRALLTLKDKKEKRKKTVALITTAVKKLENAAAAFSSALQGSVCCLLSIVDLFS